MIFYCEHYNFFLNFTSFFNESHLANLKAVPKFGDSQNYTTDTWKKHFECELNGVGYNLLQRKVNLKCREVRVTINKGIRMGKF